MPGGGIGAACAMQAVRRAPRGGSAGSCGPRACRLCTFSFRADFRGLPSDDDYVPSYTWDDIDAGLDGIAIDLPALNVKPTHGDVYADEH